jgi:hypothetical protein
MSGMDRREFITLLGGAAAAWLDAARSPAFPSVHIISVRTKTPM